MTSSTYHKDYVYGYIHISDIPYKYWNAEIIDLALKKEPIRYYETLLSLSINKEINMTPQEVLKSIPKKYCTDKIYKKLLNYDYQKYCSIVPKAYLPHIVVDERYGNVLMANFKDIPEQQRTPAMYKALSRISFEDYLMYIVNYHDIPERYLDKKTCVRMFYENIDKYIKEIPFQYRSQELCDMLVKRNFQKYFMYVPEECRTSKMYEQFVELNPVKNITIVPKEKRTQAMYDNIFECGMDNYIKLIPEKFRTKKMYQRLIKINPTKYVGLMPIKYFDVNLAVELAIANVDNFELIPREVKNEEFYLKLIKENPSKYFKFLPEEYYTDETITKIGNILLKYKGNGRISDDLPINESIIDKFPGLLGRFSDKIVLKIIKKELCEIIANNQSIDTIITKYGITNRTIINILSQIKKEDIETYQEISKRIEEHKTQEYIDVHDDIDRLDIIITALGPTTRRKLTSEKKQQIAYLIKKYICVPLEVIYTYNNSYMQDKPNEKVNKFIEYVLEYSLLIDRYEGLSETRKITFDNPWLKDFDFNKHFNIVDGKATSTYKYGDKELTPELANNILIKLASEDIPLNILIVNTAFRYYFKGELDTYIDKLHEYDKIFIEPKRRKREV